MRTVLSRTGANSSSLRVRVLYRRMMSGDRQRTSGAPVRSTHAGEDDLELARLRDETHLVAPVSGGGARGHRGAQLAVDGVDCRRRVADVAEHAARELRKHVERRLPRGVEGEEKVLIGHVDSGILQ